MHFLQNISQEYIEQNAYLGILANEDSLFNPLVRIPPQYEDTPELYLTYLMQRPEYTYFFIKYVLGLDMTPLHMSILLDMSKRKFPMLLASRGFGKSFGLALYTILQSIFIPGRKVVVAGSGFRQSKLIFEYVEKMWNDSKILRSAFSSDDGPKRGTDQYTFKFGQSVSKYIPLGSGDTIRGLRSNLLIIDEFAAVNAEVFEQVLVGFSAVSSDPINNVKKRAYEGFFKKYASTLKSLGLPWTPEETEETKSNQIIISGTADYQWNHFYRYFENYRRIIKSKGDKRKLKSIFPEGVPKNFKWDQYAVYRIPIDYIPVGFMDLDSVTRSKATVLPHIYGMEYECIFSKDSQGFFPRSKIEEATVSHSNIIDLGDGPIFFKATMSGNPHSRYVYGLDAAAESDNLAVVIIEVCNNHRRVVHCWTTRKDKFREKVKTGVVQDQAFISYVCSKIRDLMKIFPCAAIAIDAQGGGNHIAESLRDPILINTERGERPILEHIDPQKPKDTDGIPGDHILHTIQFANSKWTQEANHILKHDIESKILLFPFFDSAELALASEQDEMKRQKLGLKTATFDTLEDVIDNISELKTELSNIVHSRTPNGTERWDTPEVKTGGKSVRSLKKDRYSALVMANSVASKLSLLEFHKPEPYLGGTIYTLDKVSGKCYNGGILADKLNALYNG